MINLKLFEFNAVTVTLISLSFQTHLVSIYLQHRQSTGPTTLTNTGLTFRQWIGDAGDKWTQDESGFIGILM